jgi:predicted esterase
VVPIIVTRHASIGPFCDALKSNGDANFFFTQGTTPVNPPPEFQGFFGPPPNFTFTTVDFPELVKFNMRDFPRRETPEATIKYAVKKAGNPSFSMIKAAMSRLVEMVDNDLEIEGVIGYSEGAEIAASLILEEQRLSQEFGRIPRLKCAVFICGWPPKDPVTGNIVLADDHDGEVIKIPTCHVVGAADPFLDGSMALYNICDPDTADLFDHGGGHVIPRTKETLTDLSEVIRDMIISVA